VDALAALVPSVGVALLFWLAVRAVLNADRRERAAMTELERAERAERGDVSGPGPAQTQDGKDAGSDGIPRSSDDPAA
jgi:hypothetical protein